MTFVSRCTHNIPEVEAKQDADANGLSFPNIYGVVISKRLFVHDGTCVLKGKTG